MLTICSVDNLNQKECGAPSTRTSHPGNLHQVAELDYDYWLTSGESTPTTISSQVDVMETVSIVTGGRVHAFVPFDPLRQVAFKLRLTSTDSFTLVKKAIEERGSVGVKLYPPMGFPAYGNAELPNGFWRRDWLPSWTARPEMGQLLLQLHMKL